MADREGRLGRQQFQPHWWRDIKNVPPSNAIAAKTTLAGSGTTEGVPATCGVEAAALTGLVRADAGIDPSEPALKAAADWAAADCTPARSAATCIASEITAAFRITTCWPLSCSGMLL